MSPQQEEEEEEEEEEQQQHEMTTRVRTVLTAENYSAQVRL
jgi:hypothetical protein